MLIMMHQMVILIVTVPWVRFPHCAFYNNEKNFSASSDLLYVKFCNFITCKNTNHVGAIYSNAKRIMVKASCANQCVRRYYGDFIDTTYTNDWVDFF
jgi:hypothetical protein